MDGFYAATSNLYKTIIEQGATLIETPHYWYAKIHIRTPLAIAIADYNENISMSGNDESVSINHPYFIVNFKHFDHNTHLYNACFFRNFLNIQQLIKRGATIKPEHFLALIRVLATQEEEAESIKCAALLLLKNPTLINTIHAGETAVSRSCSNGQNNMLQFLINNKADVNRAPNTAITPLHTTILSCDQSYCFANKPSVGLKTVQLLITAGANPLSKITDGDYKNCDAYDLVKRIHSENGKLTDYGQQLWNELRKFREVERAHGTAHYRGTISTVNKMGEV